MARAIGLALLLVAAAGLRAAADPPAFPKAAAADAPRESVFNTRLLRGRLVGTSVEPVDESSDPDAPARLVFALLVIEDYTGFVGGSIVPVARVQHDAPVDVASLDTASYTRNVAARLPPDVQLGDEVLVVAETLRTTTRQRQRLRLVSAQRADTDANATRAFLAANAKVLVDLAEDEARRPPYSPQYAIELAARLRAEADTDAKTAVENPKRAWQTLMSARDQAEYHERFVSSVSSKLAVLEAIAAPATEEAAALRAVLSDLQRRLNERRAANAALVKQLNDLAGPDPRPQPPEQKPWNPFGSTDAVTGSKAAPPLLVRAKLVGVRFVDNYRLGPDPLPDLSLEFVLREEFNGPLGSLATARNAFISLGWRGDVELDSIDRETYHTTMAALLPANVRLGDDCLLSYTSASTTQRVAEIEPWTPDATDAFLARHAALVVPPLAISIEKAFDSTFKVIPSTIRETAYTRRQAPSGRSLAGRLVESKRLTTSLQYGRRKLNSARTYVERTAAQLTRIRDVAAPDVQALADQTLVMVPSMEAKAKALDAQLVVAARLDPYLGPFILELAAEE
ncbi:MAG: hypothetical protein JNM94_11885 [Phycisphaerae bacterium]|nr:hypothetical protein [Phycisphaerae bacterium]